MRSHGAIVYDEANNVIRGQCFKVKYDSGGLVTIPLEFNGDIMRVVLRTPTEEEFVVSL